MKWLDRLFERQSRALAHNLGRRHALARIGTVIVGAGALPVLPFDRIARAGEHDGGGAGAGQDPAQCDYWRYCSIDGFLCSCCGGSVTSCPPGTEISKVTWIGTCHNPEDGIDYLVSYNDCCGVTTCGRCACNTNLEDKPGYRMGQHNDVNWCMANKSTTYHCTVSVIVGQAPPKT
jgi:methylamine dehydrogenase light chain